MHYGFAHLATRRRTCRLHTEDADSTGLPRSSQPSTFVPSIEIYNNCYKFDVDDVIQLEIYRVTCTRSPQRPLASGLYLVPYGYRILCMRSSGEWAYVYLLDQRGLDLIRRAQFAHQLYRYDPGVNAHTRTTNNTYIHTQLVELSLLVKEDMIRGQRDIISSRHLILPSSHHPTPPSSPPPTPPPSHSPHKNPNPSTPTEPVDGHVVMISKVCVWVYCMCIVQAQSTTIMYIHVHELPAES